MARANPVVTFLEQIQLLFLFEAELQEATQGQTPSAGLIWDCWYLREELGSLL